MTPERHELAGGDHRCTLSYQCSTMVVLQKDLQSLAMRGKYDEDDYVETFWPSFPSSPPATHWQGNGLGLAFFRRRPLPRFGKWRSREKKSQKSPFLLFLAKPPPFLRAWLWQRDETAQRNKIAKYVGAGTTASIFSCGSSSANIQGQICTIFPTHPPFFLGHGGVESSSGQKKRKRDPSR